MCGTPQLLDLQDLNLTYEIPNAFYVIDGVFDESYDKLIIDLKNFVFSIEKVKTTQKPESLRLSSPYDTDKLKSPVLDIFINSYEAEPAIISSINSLISIAKSKGAIVRTTVMGLCGGAAGSLAIQGSKGFRVMHEKSYHFVPCPVSIKNVGFAARQPTVSKKKTPVPYVENYQSILKSTYLKNSNISKRRLTNLMRNEENYLTAKSCLNLNLCDWVLSENGIFTKYREKQR